jgi:hypothetical protein
VAKVTFDDPAVEALHRNARPIPGALEWIRDHWEEYAGRWVAVGPNGLVAAGDTYREMRAQLDSLADVLMCHVV